jgi:hypothetical protein
MTLKVLHLVFRWRVVLISSEGLVLSFDQCLHLTSPPPVGYRPPTSSLQTSRFWASLSSCPHVLPICLASASDQSLGFAVRDWGGGVSTPSCCQAWQVSLWRQTGTFVSCIQVFHANKLLWSVTCKICQFVSLALWVHDNQQTDPRTCTDKVNQICIPTKLGEWCGDVKLMLKKLKYAHKLT